MGRKRTATRTPRQQRGIETRQRLIETGLELFGAEGYHGTDSKRIAARAGVSVGSFYAYFRDKKELFLAALAEFDRRIADRITALPPEPTALLDKRRALTGYIRQILAAHTICPGFHREVNLMRWADPDVRRITDEQEMAAIAAVRRQLSAWREYVGVDDLESAAFLIHGMVETTAHAVAFADIGMDTERLVGELVVMIMRYLFPGET